MTKDIFDEVSKTKLTKSQKQFLIKRLLAYFKPYTKKFIFIVFLELLITICEALPTFIVGKILNILGGIIVEDSGVIKNLLIKYIPPQLTTVFILLAIFAIFLASVFIASYYKNLWLDKTGKKIIMSLRHDIFSHIQELNQTQINNIPVGTLITRVVNNTETLDYFYSYLMIDFIYSITSITVYISLMFILMWKMALYILIFPFIIFLLSFILRVLDRKAYRYTKKRETEINAFLSENISGIKIIQIFNKEKEKEEEFNKHSKKLKKSHLLSMSVNSVFRPLIFFISKMAEIAALWLSIKYILNGELTYGIAFSFYSYIAQFFWPINMLADQFDMLQNSLASAEKIFSLLDLKPIIKDKEDAIVLKNFKGNIEFKNVWFKYKEDEWILKDVSFKVLPGESVAIVGPTGSGKTTILNLIVKNYLPQKGEILLDGINILDLQTQSIRKAIGQMLQDVFLFSGTIYENLTFGNSEISKEEVKNAIEYVGANKILEKQKEGLDAFIQERGNNYSAGERQLLSFARAFLYKPSVMFLDEATANIDSETEIIIQKSLKKMMQVNTMLVVAHRLSTIKDSSKILVLLNGSIIEEGKHEELLKNKSYYYKLYKIQYENVAKLSNKYNKKEDK